VTPDTRLGSGAHASFHREDDGMGLRRRAERPGQPRLLFPFDPRVLGFSCTPLRCCDVAPDGQRFYAVESRTSLSPPVVTHINLIQNWFEELKAKVPGGQAK
jgi:hypothetical protein